MLIAQSLILPCRARWDRESRPLQHCVTKLGGAPPRSSSAARVKPFGKAGGQRTRGGHHASPRVSTSAVRRGTRRTERSSSSCLRIWSNARLASVQNVLGRTPEFLRRPESVLRLRSESREYEFVDCRWKASATRRRWRGRWISRLS